jgi:adenine-specific DNA-methyltransferase
MKINLLTLRNSINKAYLKVKPNRTQIETFKKNITNLFDQIKESESEEFHKNIISEFLKNTYYSPNHYINTKGRSDLVIHNEKDSKSTVGVLFEAKKPSNKSEMPTIHNINTKAFHELILYYLRERVMNKNIEVKHLVITNIFDWYIFNANDFEKLFANDKSFVKQFTDFEEGRLPGINTDFFYKNIAEPFVSVLDDQISVTHFDIRDFETIIKNANLKDDNKLIALYKILSPEHLLKLPFANDSNNLDKTFYNELLHIIGLEETKEGSKRLIGRKIEKKRNPGSLIENSITILKYEDCLSQLPKLSDFGNDKEEQLFNISLELVITWINRILFLKLLEGQLIKYNNGDKSFRFLNIEKIHDFDELNKLFFQVLAVKESDRTELIKHNFGNIPYLNSSLFDPSELEHKTIRINSLDDHSEIPVLSGTVLKDKSGRKLTGIIDPLHYIFEFLDSYDFSSEGSEDIQEENKTLINASVLGLIFEKINGYKDGSFFTPGFITMYMCHETIRRAVIQKFNERKGWKCETLSDVYNEIEDIYEANRIINSLKICDPAVGSGHFLVSALNEIIAIKSELKILSDTEGKKLKEYTIEAINDELIITDEQSKLFVYNPKSKESQRVQEALFQEKQSIIENCLFGVDINPNSVKICRLRLWIELLKNAYYKADTNYKELETLPNIDINIKCGNSLISRYPLNADIKIALKSSKWTVDNYREAVMNYRNAGSKEEKRTLENLISTIKNDFATEVSRTNQDIKSLNKYKNELLQLTSAQLFDYDDRQKKDWFKRLESLNSNIEKLELKISEIKNNKVFENAFEWRFEFPEVLNNDGDFVGFDVVIGNPPYGLFNKKLNQRIALKTDAQIIELIKERYPEATTGIINAAKVFYLLGLHISQNVGFQTMIIPLGILTDTTSSVLRKYIFDHHTLIKVESFPERDSVANRVFEDAKISTAILISNKKLSSTKFELGISKSRKIETLNRLILSSKDLIELNPELVQIPLIDKEKFELLLKIYRNKAIIKIKKISPCLTGEVDMTFGKHALTNERHHKKLIKGVQIDRYMEKNENKDISQGIIEYLNLSEFLKSYQGKKLHDAFERRIVLQGLTGINEKIRLKSTLVQPECYLANSCNYILANNLVSLEYILSLLNSSLLNFIFKCKSTSSNVNGYEVDDLPIIINENLLPKLENIVLKISSAKKSDPIADISSLELEIDRLVYELYGLTEEEICIVEKN